MQFAHQCVVRAEELDVLRDADEAGEGRVRQPGRDRQLDLAVILMGEERVAC